MGNSLTTTHNDGLNFGSHTGKASEGNSPSFTAAAGYEFTFKNNLTVGIEADFNYVNDERENKNTYTASGTGYEVKDRIKMNYAYGGYFTLGKKLENGLHPFILLGYKAASAKLSSASDSLNISGHQNKSIHGFSGGLGFNYKLSEKLKLRVSGIYTQYDSFSTKNFDSDTGETHKFSVKIKSYTYGLGVSYNF
jgi:opacity protein-like surface antigen